MRRALWSVVLLWAAAAAAFGQQSDASLKSFQERFDSGDIAAKAKVLEDSAQQPGIDVGPLSLQALSYIVGNIQALRADPSGSQLAVDAAKLAAQGKLAQTADPLWALFTADSDTAVRIAVMQTLSGIAAGRQDLTDKMNLWLATQNTLVDGGTKVDVPVIDACVAALGVIASSTSFPVLFATSLENYPTQTQQAAAAAYDRVKGTSLEHYTAVIRLNRASDKVAALQAAVSSPTISDSDKTDIAIAALQTALDATTRNTEAQATLNRLRFAAASELGSLKWAPATGLLIQNFDRALDEYTRGILSDDDLMISITSLGATGTHEAAVRLSLYLDLIHTYVEKGQTVSERVVTAVIGSLGAIGDPVALENLLYTQYLKYPETVEKAAREAVANLRTR